MNKFILILFFALISCKGSSQDEKTANNLSNLKTSFLSKDEKQFLENFPETFTSFKNNFGWNDTKDIPEPLYNDANKYIDYWFSLLQKPENKNYSKQIISISKNGKWEADAINYFRTKAINYIKNEKKYDLINSLNKKDAESVLSFFFDSPHPISDPEFFKGLNKENQEIVKNLLANNISEEKTRSTLSNYENNDNYFVETFDVNKDGISDKVVSTKPYQEENELFVFYGNTKGQYNLVLETTNFSEDGGNIIESISPISNEKGLIVRTSFPDREYYEKEYYLVPQKDTWFLRNIIYKTMSDVSKNAIKYVCDVKQDIDITKSGWSVKINPIPEENERNKKCYVENGQNKQFYQIQDPDGYTNLRKEKNASSQILQKIKSGEQIEVLDKSNDWWLIKTKEGEKGYVHKSRIK